jgi:hypothetical protein
VERLTIPGRIVILNGAPRESRHVDPIVSAPDARSPSNGPGRTITLSSTVVNAARRSSTYFSRLTNEAPPDSTPIVTHRESRSGKS